MQSALSQLGLSMNSINEFFSPWNSFPKFSIFLYFPTESALPCVLGESAAFANVVSRSTAAANQRCLFPPHLFSHPTFFPPHLFLFSHPTIYVSLSSKLKQVRARRNLNALHALRLKYILCTYWEHTEYILSTYWVHIKNRTDWVQDVECNCLMVNHTVGSLFSCQSGCNRWPHTFLNSLMIDTISSWLDIQTE